MKRPRRRYGWLWGAGLLFSAGYLAAFIARQTAYAAKAPVIGTAAAVGLTIPFAARARGALRGAFRGLGLGLAGSMGISLAMIDPGKPISAELLRLDVTITAVTSMICCAAAGATFALLAERRRRLLEAEDGP